MTYGLKNTKVGIVLKKIEEIARHHKMFQIELADKVKKWDEKEEIGGIFAASVSLYIYLEIEMLVYVCKSLFHSSKIGVVQGCVLERQF